jgi:NAD(P)H-dependent FMN reductase
MDTLNIPVVLGTARIDNRSAGIARAAVEVINNIDGYNSELVDVKEHVTQAVTTPPWGEGGAETNPTAWQTIVQKSHALVLVVPEYNHSFPGELKILLDSLWDDYQHKAVGLIGVSAGTLGAARVIDHIKPVLIELKLQPVKDGVHISKAADALSETGGFANEKTVEYLTKMVEEIVTLSTALKTLKTN